MCLENLCKEIAGEYRLPAGEARSFLERTLSTSLSESLGKRSVVLISGNDISVYRERGGDGCPVLEQLPLSELNRKLLRHCRYRIGSELRKRMSLMEYDYLKHLQGTVVRGKIDKIRDDNSLVVLFCVEELFKRREIIGICSLSQQPPIERGKYRRGEARSFLVAKVRLTCLCDQERLFMVDVRLSRSSRLLPELLLKMKSECADIRCIRRIAGRISFVASKEKLPREAIREVSAELGERVIVTWE